MSQCELRRALVVLASTVLITQSSFAKDTENVSSLYDCSDNEESYLRVRGTSFKNVGHLEICHARIWGVICADNWTPKEAQVACRQLTGATASQATSIDPAMLKMWNETGFYTQDQRQRKQWLRYIYCKGEEERLTDCWYDLPSRKKPFNVSYIHADSRNCFAKLEIGSVTCQGTVNTLSTTATMPSATTNGVTSGVTTLAANVPISRANDGDRTTTYTTSGNPGGLGSKVIVNTPSTKRIATLMESKANQGTAVSSSRSTSPLVSTSPLISTSTLVVNVKKSSSNTFLVPFVIIAVACILLTVDVSRKLRQAINLQNDCKQLRLQVALVEGRNELILYNERENPAGEINVGVTISEPTSVKFSSLANTDDADGVYSKPTVVPSQGQTKTADTVSAGADSTYSKVGIVIAADSSMSTKKTSGDVYSLPTPRCSRVSPELKKPNTNSSGNTSDEDHDEGGDQPVVPPKAYEENEA